MLGFDLRKAVSLSHFYKEFQESGKIGSGGFSTVYRVRNKRDNRSYALKVVKIKPSEYKHDISDYIDKVLGEVKILSGLNHPNVLKYHGCWIDGELKSEQQIEEQESEKEEEELQLVFYEDSLDSCGFDFAEGSESQKQKKSFNKKSNKKVHLPPDLNIFGEDLSKYKEIRIYILTQLGEHSLQKYVELRNRERRNNAGQSIDFTKNYQIILNIIEGLHYIHSQNIIHRDLKLQNVIVDEKGKCKVIDFGLAKRARMMKSMDADFFGTQDYSREEQIEIQKHSSSVGTRIYSSPEQTSSNSYDYRTDIYSLAMVIAILFSEYITIHEERQLLANIRNRKLESIPIPEKLKEIVFRCLGEQKNRPGLKQIKSIVLGLMREKFFSKNENAVQGINKIGTFGYLSKNGKMRKRIPLTMLKQKNMPLNQQVQQIEVKT